ncbi:hypothetical protein Emag_002709 [Eimeria magna]
MAQRPAPAASNCSSNAVDSLPAATVAAAETRTAGSTDAAESLPSEALIASLTEAQVALGQHQQLQQQQLLLQQQLLQQQQQQNYHSPKQEQDQPVNSAAVEAVPAPVVESGIGTAVASSEQHGEGQHQEQQQQQQQQQQRLNTPSRETCSPADRSCSTADEWPLPRGFSESPSDDNLPSGAAAALRAIGAANAAAAAAAAAAVEEATAVGASLLEPPAVHRGTPSSSRRGRQHRKQMEEETPDAAAGAAAGLQCKSKRRRSDEGSSKSSSKSREASTDVGVPGYVGGPSTPEKSSATACSAAPEIGPATPLSGGGLAACLPASTSPFAGEQQQQQQQPQPQQQQDGSRRRMRRGHAAGRGRGWRSKEEGGAPTGGPHEEGDPSDVAGGPSPCDSQQQQQQQQQQDGEIVVPPPVARKRRAVGYVFVVEGGALEDGAAGAAAAAPGGLKKEDADSGSFAAAEAAGRFSTRLRQRPDLRGAASGGTASPSCEVGGPLGGPPFTASPLGGPPSGYGCDAQGASSSSASYNGAGPLSGGPCSSLSRRSGGLPGGPQDPAARQRFLVSQRRIRGVEKYLQLCEQMYFGFWSGRPSSSSSSSSGRGSAADSTADVEVVRGGGGALVCTLGAGAPEGEAFGDGGPDSQVGAVIHRLIVCNNTQRERAAAAAAAAAAAGHRGSSKEQQQQDALQQQKRGGPPKIKLTPIELLTSPLRHRNVVDLWGPKEVALFEAGICKHGKDFNLLQRLIGTKTTKEVVDFYYLWKQTNRYASWKAHRNLSRTMLHSVFG